MSESYKTFEGKTYFITFSTVEWIDVFTRIDYQEILADSIRYCQQHKGLLLYCYCIMTNHVHCIASREQGTISDLLRDMKSFTAKRIIDSIRSNLKESRKLWMMEKFHWNGKISSQEQTYQFWQHENHPFELFSTEMFQQKRNYIHENPVRAGFVDQAWKWRWSSANPDSPIQVIESYS
jgi:putative transposase